MHHRTVNFANLRNLIGHEVHYNGSPFRIIEILEDGPHLILQHQEFEKTIQPDQHGEAHRKVPRTVTLPVIDHHSQQLSVDFHSLNLAHLL